MSQVSGKHSSAIFSALDQPKTDHGSSGTLEIKNSNLREVAQKQLVDNGEVGGQIRVAQTIVAAAAPLAPKLVSLINSGATTISSTPVIAKPLAPERDQALVKLTKTASTSIKEVNYKISQESSVQSLPKFHQRRLGENVLESTFLPSEKQLALVK